MTFLPYGNEFSKTRKIIELLKEIDERSHGEDKTIIFSQFTSMLDIIEPFLEAEGIEYVRCKFFLSVLCKEVLSADG